MFSFYNLQIGKFNILNHFLIIIMSLIGLIFLKTELKCLKIQRSILKFSRSKNAMFSRYIDVTALGKKIKSAL